MALTKIFTGMAQGPETIDANFTQIAQSIVDAKTDITTIHLTPIAGATDPCVMTVIGGTLVNLEFNGRYPTKGGPIYWMDTKYAPKGDGVSFAIPHNNLEGTQMVITIRSDGAIVLFGNSDDTATAFGSYAYNCRP